MNCVSNRAKNSTWQNDQNNVNSISKKPFEKMFFVQKQSLHSTLFGLLMI